MDEKFNVCGEYVFRGIEYRVSFHTVDKPGRCLSVEVEDKITGDQWRGFFDHASVWYEKLSSHKYVVENRSDIETVLFDKMENSFATVIQKLSKDIEELTRKTGNFKQFDVFLSMLESALDKTTDSVTLDLLTFADLELLRNRKAVSGGYQGNTKHRPASKHQENKRYLILVYSVEFDRIHYPLPLPYQGKPDPIQLQNLVRQLNDEINRLKAGKSSASYDKAFLRLKEDYDTLSEEKQNLEEALLEMKSELQKNGKVAVSKEVRVLKKVVQNLELEMLKEKNRFQRVVAKKSAEVKRLSEELHDLAARERTLQIRVKSLTNELALYKRSRTPLPISSINRDSRTALSRSQDRSRPRSSVLRSNSGVCQSGSLHQRRSLSHERLPSQKRDRSTSKGSRSSVSRSSNAYRSRTPTPNRFPRFDPTSYNEERKRKLRASQEQLKRQSSAGFSFGSGDSRGRTKSRIGSRSALRRRNASVESVNSSDNGSVSRRSHRWADSPDSRRLFSTPNVMRHRSLKPYPQKRMVSGDPDINEIDARLEALQQYMKEIEK